MQVSVEAEWPLPGIKYLVFQVERCPDTGRLHLQGYVQFNNQTDLQLARELLSKTAHLEPAKGTPLENRT